MPGIVYSLGKKNTVCAFMCNFSSALAVTKEHKKWQTFDRQEWYYDILMCSTAGKYSLCLHFLFFKVLTLFGEGWDFSERFSPFFLSVFVAPMLTLTEQIENK